MHLTQEQFKIHGHALELAKRHRTLEAELVETLQKVERLKIHKSLGKRSLFLYATETLKLDEAVAYALITVARKSAVIPELKISISEGKLAVSKACRIMASLNSSNASELLRFAETHSKREIELEVAKRNPKAKTREKVKALSDEWLELKASISPKTLAMLKRVESLLAQKGKEHNLDQVLSAGFNAYLEKHDPVRKAERAEKRESLCPGRIKQQREVKEQLEVKIKEFKKSTSQRIPLTAAQKHAVHLRDQGKCTHVDLQGQRCNQDRWTDIHHIVPVSRGGTNDPENLTTLCSYHHDLAHQLCLPLEGQITWLRSPRLAYG